jgi:hypothetical protein
LFCALAAASGLGRGGFLDSKADLGECGEDEAGELRAEAAVKLGWSTMTKRTIANLITMSRGVPRLAG